jgi:hypothetical protein
LLPLPSLGEGWGEGKPMWLFHLIFEFGIAAEGSVDLLDYLLAV